MQQRILSWHLRACLGALALMLTVPFLIAHHYNPIPAFYAEWTAAALSLAVLSWLIHADGDTPLEIPEITLLPLGLMLIGVLQAFLQPAALTDRLLIFGLYMAWASLLVILGRRLALDAGIETLADLMATAILIGALLEALTGGVQLAGMARLPWIFPYFGGGLRGNLAQPNNFADYLWLGVAATLYLHHRALLRNTATGMALLILLPFAVLSGSRSVWFYSAGLTAFTMLWTWRQPEGRPLRLWCAGALLGSLAFQAAFSTGLIPLPDQLVTAGGRMADVGSYDRIRPTLWRIAFETFMEHPWLGAGFGQYTQQFHLHVLELMPRRLPGLPENAHNVLLNLVAEMGVGAGLMLVFFGVRWVLALARAPRTPAGWWIAASLLVLAIHANLEYPLWYAFFLGIASLLAGAASRSNRNLRFGRSSSIIMSAILMLGTLSLYNLKEDYSLLEDTLNYRITAQSAAEYQQIVEANLTRLAGESLLRPYVDLTTANLMTDNGEALETKLLTCQRAQHFSPSNSIVFKCAHLLALANRDTEAELALRRAVAAYPDRAEMVLKQWRQRSSSEPAIARLLKDFPPIGPATP